MKIRIKEAGYTTRDNRTGKSFTYVQNSVVKETGASGVKRVQTK